MGAVHIGIGHNYNLIISQLLDVKIFMNSRSKSGNHCAYLGISIDSVKSGFFYVQNLSSPAEGLPGSIYSWPLLPNLRRNLPQLYKFHSFPHSYLNSLPVFPEEPYRRELIFYGSSLWLFWPHPLLFLQEWTFHR